VCKTAFIIGVTAIFANSVLALSGSGTEAEPWRIQSLADFNEFAADANYWDDHTRLETDVNLAGFTYTMAVIAPDVWNSNCAFDGIAFSGVFDGNDHKITGLTIDGGETGNEYLGLFGRNNGEVRNLGLEGGSVRGSGCNTAGFVVQNCGIVSNCHSVVDVNGYFPGGHVGGLVAENEEDAVVTDCYFAGHVIGDYSVAGLVSSNKGIVSNCFWDTEAQTHGVSESVGEDFDGATVNVTGLPTAQMQTESTFSSGGWDFLGEWANGTSETWRMPAEAGYPVLSILEGDVRLSLAGSGTIGDPYLISEANDLGMARWYPQDCCFEDGHKLNNLRISGGGWWLGFFGYLGNGGQISRLGLEGGSVAGIGHGVGALVGMNDRGSVSQSYSTADVQGGPEEIGGLVGENFGGNVLNCFWDIDRREDGLSVSINTISGSVKNDTGLPTAAMQTKSTFTSAGWDGF